MSVEFRHPLFTPYRRFCTRRARSPVYRRKQGMNVCSKQGHDAQEGPTRGVSSRLEGGSQVF